MIIECIELNWLYKHTKKVRSSEATIPILNWVKHSFFLWLSLMIMWITITLSVFSIDLVYFASSTSDTNATRATQMEQECDINVTSARQVTRATWVRQECYTNNTNATWVRLLILITTQVKIYFHTPMWAIWEMKDYKERNNFILRTNFWKCPVSMPKYIWKEHHKNWNL